MSARYVGTHGVYSHSVAYEKDPECIVCSAGVALQVAPSLTLQQVGGGALTPTFVDQFMCTIVTTV